MQVLSLVRDGMWKIREFQDKVANVVMNYSEVESKVREATNDDQWGPHGTLMNEIAKFTFMYESFPEVMGMLWKRMLVEKKNWRRTYKSLLLLHYLLRNGSERVVTSARDHLYDMRQLENYQCTDENGKDQGLNVRHKVKELIDFIQDSDRLRQERKRAKENREKYIGLSSDVVSDGFYSDRYDKEPSGRRRDDFDSMDYQRKSKLGEFRDKIGQKLSEIRPGKRDYRDYNEQSRNGRNVYKDEPEDGEEVSEEKYVADEDVFSYQSAKPSESDLSVSSRSSTSSLPLSSKPQQLNKPQVNKPTAKIDLGAAATLVNVAKAAENKSAENGISQQAPPSSTTSASAMSDLVDLMNTGPTDSPLVPMNNTSKPDLFGTFVGAPDATQSGNGDFADFGAFDSAKPANDESDFGDFNSFSIVASAASQDPSSLQGLDLFDSSSPNASKPPAPSMQSMQSMQSAQSMQGQGFSLSTPYQPTASFQSAGSFQSPPSFQSAATYQSSGVSQRMTTSPANQRNLATNTQTSTSAQTSKEKASLWSNSGLDISLDTLSPVATKDKPTQPSMNEMTAQQLMSSPMSAQPLMPTMSSPSSMYGGASMSQVNTGMSSMGLGTGAVRPMTMGTQPMQPMGVNPQAMRMNTQTINSARPQSMGMGAAMPNVGMASNQNMLNFGIPASQYNYPQAGMRMPMQAQMYQSQMQGTMGQFRS